MDNMTAEIKEQEAKCMADHQARCAQHAAGCAAHQEGMAAQMEGERDRLDLQMMAPAQREAEMEKRWQAQYG